MENKENSYRLIEVLNEWDPFKIGEGNFDPEIADIIQAVHDFDDHEKIAVRIQDVFEFSFEKRLSIEECRTVANTLLSIKKDDVCSL